MSVGILGGTFDPIHLGHLRLAEQTVDQLGLDEVRFIPSREPPHRPPTTASAEDRLAMVQRAIADHPLFRLDQRELDRPGPSYMVDTLASLRAELGPATPVTLLLGADAFLGLPGWFRWRDLFGLANLGVACRPGYDLAASMPVDLQPEWNARSASNPVSTPSGGIYACAMDPVNISASDIRERVRRGLDVSDKIPAAVYDYLKTQSLYQKEPHGT